MNDAVFVLGAGRAGLGLARALRASGIALAGVHGRRKLDAGGLRAEAGPLPAGLNGATIVLVAVRDGQLQEALAEVAAAVRDTVVLQCSGSADASLLDAVRGAGCPAGTFHPLVPLAEPAMAPALLRGAWIGVDGDAAARAAAERLAAALGARTLTIPAGGKTAYHAAAVFASNFPTVLASLATRLMIGAGIAAPDAAGAVGHLMAAAAANVQAERPEQALTGPVSRGDVETVGRLLAALAGVPDVRAVYVLLSREAVRLARARGGDPPAERLDAIAGLLEAV